MQTHFHLILMTAEANLNRFMQRFNTTYTVYFNRRHRRIGHLFQGRYKAILIEKDEYLVELSRYVHLNPGRIKEKSQLEVGESRRYWVPMILWIGFTNGFYPKRRWTVGN
jgi:putative transposase